jgi:hypothetical protein
MIARRYGSISAIGNRVTGVTREGAAAAQEWRHGE